MAAGGRKLFSTREAIESIWADNDSGNENFDCGSDFEDIPDTEDELQSEESDLDSSLAIPQCEMSQEQLASLESDLDRLSGICL